MHRYTISDLEQLSGIKAHTIRIWEKRYKALKPKRSLGNTRYYDDGQLRKLLNIVSLSETGKKISELFAMPETNLNALLQEQMEKTKSTDLQFEYFISQLIVAGLNYDETTFEKHYSAALVRYGMRSAYVNIIHPMLVRIGLIWGKDELCPAQEHFLSNIILQKIHASIDGLPSPATNRRRWLLFLPDGESHEIGLLFSNYIIRATGQKTIYLGSNVPFDALKESVMDVQPTDILFFFIKNRSGEEAQNYLKGISKVGKNRNIHLAGNFKLISKLKLGKNIYWIQSVQELERLLMK